MVQWKNVGLQNRRRGFDSFYLCQQEISTTDSNVIKAKKTNPDSPFRNVNNVLLMRELFLETASTGKHVLFTLRPHSYKGYPCLRDLYLEANDPTEYKFAVENFESWDHWAALSATDWLAPYILLLRRELEVKLRSEGLETIISTAKSDKNSAFQAAKYLTEQGWDKTAVKSAKKAKTWIDQDYERLFEDASVN